MTNQITNIIPTLLADFYKVAHKDLYPEKTQEIYSLLTPRNGKYAPYTEEVVAWGETYLVKEYFVKVFNELFFNRPKAEVVAEYVRFIKFTLGATEVDSTHIAALHDVGFLPLEVKALPEGTCVPFNTPVLSIRNTIPEFFWLTNFMETLLSTTLWQMMTSATISRAFRKLLNGYAVKTTGSTDGVEFQGHDFSMRGMSSLETAMLSGAGHLLNFVGTDTMPAIMFHEMYYNANIETELVGTSIPACYDDETEILTENGWKLFKDLNENEKVAQYHEDGLIDFVVPSAYYNMPYKGKMVTFTSKEKGNKGYVDFSVTPNHRMIRRKKSDNSLQVFEADSKKYHEKNGYSSKNKVIISGKVKNNKNNLSDLEKLMIAFQADGSYLNRNEKYNGEKTNTRPIRFALKKERKKERLINILDKLEYEYTCTKDNNDYYSFYIKVPKEINMLKDFSWIKINNISLEWANQFIEELQYWDGKKASKNTILYSSNNFKNIEIVQIIATLSGNKTLINENKDNRNDYNRQINYTISIQLNKETIDGRIVTKSYIDYDSTVHCVSVPTKMLVVRKNNVVGISGNTEHSVMSAGTRPDSNRDERETYKRIITKVHPNGFVSIVSDTYDFWKVVTETLPSLKEEIEARDGRVVIRPDSGNPIDILCGTESVFGKGVQPEEKGLIECLWETFGGTINEQGYKVLNSKIGAIYGDSITLERCKAICEKLEEKGFASTNVVYGIGSYTYNFATRDTLGFAMKATAGIIDGEHVMLFKDPKTDVGKRSHKGRVAVLQTENGIEWKDGFLKEEDIPKESLLQTIFLNGKVTKETSLQEIRERLAATI